MISVFGLCLLYVLIKGKDHLETAETIVTIVVMIIIGLLIIPVGGLTGFHIMLVSRGRTTNEQVTGKFRGGHNPFTEGCAKNCLSALCSPHHPKYLGRKKKAAYSSVVMVQATNLASEKDVKIHIQRSANGGNAGTHHGPGVAVQQGATQRQKQAPSKNQNNSSGQPGNPEMIPMYGRQPTVPATTTTNPRSNYDNIPNPGSSSSNNNPDPPASLFEPPASKFEERPFQPTTPVSHIMPSAASMRPPPVPAAPSPYDAGFGNGGAVNNAPGALDMTPNSSSVSLAHSASSSSQLIQSTTPPSIYQKGVSGLPSPFVQSNAPPLVIATMSTTNVNNISFIDDGASEAGDVDSNLYHHRPHLSLPKDRDQRPSEEIRRHVGGGGGLSGGGRTYVSQPPSVPPTEEEPTIYYSLHV